MVLASALYRHDALDEIRRRLRDAEDFDWDESLSPKAEDTWQVAWLETKPGAASLPAPLGRRILATLTLTPTTLKVETISRRRRRACRRRLHQLLGNRIQLQDMESERAEGAGRKPGTGPEPLQLPSEAIAELEERMIRQWLDESIPALGGLTPRQAAKTAEGRKRLDDLFDYMARDQAERTLPPGVFSPDYGKAKKMLGLE